MAMDYQNSAPSTAHDAGSPQHTPAVHPLADQLWSAGHNRLRMLASASSSARSQVDHLLALARRGLPRMYKDGSFGHTLRAVKVKSQWTERLEGDNLRYVAMVALGLAHTDEATQRQVLDGATAAELAMSAAKRAETAVDPGEIALAAWAAAEVAHIHAPILFRRLAEVLASGTPLATVACAWALTAALAARRLGDTSDVMVLARNKLLASRSPSGIFPHVLPASAAGRMRAHIGSFADQVYPIQAFARYYSAFGDKVALATAERTAAQICALQGEDGQWWWHYDTRDGAVAEGYPVYSVHQHAMAPMVLMELREAGGGDYLPAIVKGLRWLDQRPEIDATLVEPEKGVVWRKVARREPNKAVRAMAAFTTSLSPGLHVPGVDMLFPPRTVDYECRPYELGWLLYAWLSGGVVANLAAGAHGGGMNVPEEV